MSRLEGEVDRRVLVFVACGAQTLFSTGSTAPVPPPPASSSFRFHWLSSSPFDERLQRRFRGGSTVLNLSFLPSEPLADSRSTFLRAARMRGGGARDLLLLFLPSLGRTRFLGPLTHSLTHLRRCVHLCHSLSPSLVIFSSPSFFRRRPLSGRTVCIVAKNGIKRFPVPPNRRVFFD